MKNNTKKVKINHYPDWIFYLLIALSFVGGFAAFHFYFSTSRLNESLINKSDSLNFERRNVLELSSRFINQSQMVIKNSGINDFTVDMYVIFYFDEKDKRFKSLKGTIQGIVKGGAECKPQYVYGDNTIWDGRALAYYIEVVSMKNYIIKDKIVFCKLGTINPGEPITLNVDETSKIIDFPATCY
jgi:hypothetical protein